MNRDLTDEETVALLRELDSHIDCDRYFMSPRIKTLKAIRTKIRRGSQVRKRLAGGGDWIRTSSTRAR